MAESSVFDLRDLEEVEKYQLVVMLNYLHDVSQMEMCKREDYLHNSYFAQKRYIVRVKRYLDVDCMDSNGDYSWIDNIDSIKKRKALLRVVCECMFLKYNSVSFLEEEFTMEIIGQFDLAVEVAREFTFDIMEIFQREGVEGLYPPYEKEDSLLDIAEFGRSV